MKNLILIITMMLSFTFVNAQKSTKAKDSNLKSSIGFQLSTTNGSGFTYRLKSNKHAISTSFLPIWQSSEGQTDFSYSFGLNHEYFLYEGGFASVSVLTGFQLSNLDLFDDERRLSAGISPNLYLNMTEHFSLGMNVGYGVYSINNGTTSFLTAGTSFYYHL